MSRMRTNSKMGLVAVFGMLLSILALPAGAVDDALGAGPALGLGHPVSPGPDTAVQVDSGRNHVCAVTDGGHAFCWGDNLRGQIGQGPIGGQVNEPAEVVEGAGLTPGTVAQISGGREHTCAVDTGGDAYCWGNNSSGRLGNGDPDNSNSGSPAKVAGNLEVAQISAGSQHTCAVTTGGDAYCWGDNFFGQLGNGTSGAGTGQNTPVQVVGLSGVAQISAGLRHTCAVDTGGDAYCWGTGQLGNGVPGSSTTPVQVVEGQGLTPGTVAQISADSHTCAVDTGGDAYCWGGMFLGVLGNGTSGSGSQPEPGRVSDLGSGTDAGAVAHIDAAEFNSCATTVDGEAYCWGWNAFGQVGDGTSGSGTDSDTPQWVIGSGVAGSGVVADFVHVGGGRAHTCGVDAVGIVYCWGKNDKGELGDGTGQPPELVGGRPLLGPALPLIS